MNRVCVQCGRTVMTDTWVTKWHGPYYCGKDIKGGCVMNDFDDVPDFDDLGNPIEDEDSAAGMDEEEEAADTPDDDEVGDDGHTHTCSTCGHEWTCLDDEDDCDLACPVCPGSSVEA